MITVISSRGEQGCQCGPEGWFLRGLSRDREHLYIMHAKPMSLFVRHPNSLKPALMAPSSPSFSSPSEVPHGGSSDPHVLPVTCLTNSLTSVLRAFPSSIQSLMSLRFPVQAHCLPPRLSRHQPPASGSPHVCKSGLLIKNTLMSPCHSCPCGQENLYFSATSGPGSSTGHIHLGPL